MLVNLVHIPASLETQLLLQYCSTTTAWECMLALLVTKKQKTKGVRVSLCRRTGPKESIPRHPITPFTNTGLLLALFAGLWLGDRVGVTVCVIMYIMCSISSTHCDPYSFVFSFLFSFLFSSLFLLIYSPQIFGLGPPSGRAFDPQTLGLI